MLAIVLLIAQIMFFSAVVVSAIGSFDRSSEHDPESATSAWIEFNKRSVDAAVAKVLNDGDDLPETLAALKATYGLFGPHPREGTAWAFSEECSASERVITSTLTYPVTGQAELSGALQAARRLGATTAYASDGHEPTAAGGQVIGTVTITTTLSKASATCTPSAKLDTAPMRHAAARTGLAGA